MKTEIKEKWVAALRSGKYKQGRQLLRNLEEDSWCCLGVLCDLAIKDGLNLKVEVGRGEWTKGASYNGRSSFLPWEVIEWAGLDSSIPGIERTNLVEMNDGGVDFTEIADAIERNL